MRIQSPLDSTTPHLPRRAVLAAIGLLLTHTLYSAPEEKPEIVLSINGHSMRVEVARSGAARRQGLANRRTLAEDRGMLFVFPKPSWQGMWMKDTCIPLSVAFLDGRGVIINIADMEPRSETVHYASRPARYALEVNDGWFEKHGINTGMRVEGVDRALDVGGPSGRGGYARNKQRRYRPSPASTCSGAA